MTVRRRRCENSGKKEQSPHLGKLTAFAFWVLLGVWGGCWFFGLVFLGGRWCFILFFVETKNDNSNNDFKTKQTTGFLKVM